MQSLYEDEYDALNRMVANSSKSAKELAVYLFPHLKMDSAYARLKACLNPEKEDKLSLGQVIAAMRFCGTYDPLQFICDETLHTRPERKAPEDHAARIAEAIDGATATLNVALKALAQLQARGGAHP